MSSRRRLHVMLLVAVLACSAARAQLSGGSNPGQIPVLEASPGSSCTPPISSVISQQGDDITILNTTGSTTHDVLFINVVVDGVPRLFAAHTDLPASAMVHLHVHFLRSVGSHSIELCGNWPVGTHDSDSPILSVEVVNPGP